MKYTNLIDTLVKNPKKFNKLQLTYELLNEFYKGAPIELLEPLLNSDNPQIHEPVIWIASELGEKAFPLLETLKSLYENGNRYVKHHILELFLLCSSADEIDAFKYIIQGLKDDDNIIRLHSMFLLSNAKESQILAITDSLISEFPKKDELLGVIHWLKSTEISIKAISALLSSNNFVERKIGVILLKRNDHLNNVDFKNEIISTKDKDVLGFYEKYLQDT